MDSKTVILVIILAVFVGVGIFFGQNMLRGTGNVSSSFKVNGNLTSEAPKTPEQKPIPTFPPLNSGSNLQSETEKLDPPDFSGEYKSLKDEVNK